MTMTTIWTLAAVVLSSAAITYGHAAHDVAAARRFRGLSPTAVASRSDHVRNRRWHDAGWALRATGAVLIGAVAGLTMGRWSAFFLGTAVAGSISTALFDVLFAVKFGQAWNYLGTTAANDVRAQARLAGLLPAPGTVALLLEGALVVVAAAGWLLWA